MNLENEIYDIIDSSWHFSWHWKKDQYGHLNLEGWQEALRDGKGLLNSFEIRIRELKRVLPLIEAEISKRQKWDE